MKNRITTLFNIQYPIIQAGMIWNSGWRLAAAVSNAGGLGIIGSGSMYPDILDEHIQKCKAATDKPFAVNLPLIYPAIEEHVATIIKHNVPIVFISAGNPKAWTAHFKEHGITVVHVVPSVKFALKAEAAGVNAIVAEGFEAGGHNGVNETTTFTLIPMVTKAVKIPVIAAGGIGNGAGMLAAMNLGADAVQIGSRFVASVESSGHANFKNAVIEANDGDTILTLKELAPVRLIKNDFYQQVVEAYQKCSSKEELKELLGRARAKKGMFEGDLSEGELEIGQVAGLIDKVMPAAQIVAEIVSDYKAAVKAQNTDDKFQF